MKLKDEIEKHSEKHTFEHLWLIEKVSLFEVLNIVKTILFNRVNWFMKKISKFSEKYVLNEYYIKSEKENILFTEIRIKISTRNMANVFDFSWIHVSNGYTSIYWIYLRFISRDYHFFNCGLK